MIRQRDVKQSWNVTLNGKRLGRLQTDENDLVASFTIPSGALKSGDNELKIAPSGRRPDDIWAGEIRIDPRPPGEALAESTVEIRVVDAENGRPLPCRLTITNAAGTLVPTSAKSNDRLAVRTGVIYTGDGRAKFGVPAGKYVVYAGRGFEYSLAKAEFEIAPGGSVRKDLSLRREVPTPGWVACDTHVHTLTYSRHGDASVEERAITIAGEGIELAVATDHNLHADYEPAAKKTGVRQWFTPVIGNEVTTKIGHFNAFPVKASAPPAKTDAKSWTELTPEIRKTPGVKMVILNHPRNVHSGFQPTGPERFNAVSGENLDGWTLDADGFEVLTSAALQSDVWLPYRDWFALLNRGIKVSP
ncbi:MAG: hypothetical protein N2C14_32585, partial [Planctomycetales bacterium]